MDMKLGSVFRYTCKLSNGNYVTWRVCAETRVGADIMIADYVAECKKNGFYNIPVEILWESVSKEEDLVLF